MKLQGLVVQKMKAYISGNNITKLRLPYLDWPQR